MNNGLLVVLAGIFLFGILFLAYNLEKRQTEQVSEYIKAGYSQKIVEDSDGFTHLVWARNGETDLLISNRKK